MDNSKSHHSLHAQNFRAELMVTFAVAQYALEILKCLEVLHIAGWVGCLQEPCIKDSDDRPGVNLSAFGGHVRRNYSVCCYATWYVLLIMTQKPTYLWELIPKCEYHT